MNYKLFYKLYKILPKPLQQGLVSQFINLPDSLPQGVSIKTAETANEMEQAFKILHDATVESGSFSGAENGLRIPSYLVFPSTSIVVAIKNQKVIATMAIVLNGEICLPCENLINLKNISDLKDTRFVEFTSLAIEKTHRGRKGSLLFYMLKYAFFLSTKHLQADYILATVRPWRIPLYEAIFNFERVQQHSQFSPAIAQGSEVNVVCLDTKKIELEAYRRYSHQKPTKNIYQFYYQQRDSDLVYKEHRFYGGYLRNHESTTLQDVFLNKGETNFKGIDRKIFNSYLNINRLESPSNIIQGTFAKSRQSHRYYIPLEAEISLTAKKESIEILDVSNGGCLLRSQYDLKLGESYLARVLVGKFDVAEISVTVVRTQENFYGVTVIKSCNIWNEFIEYIDRNNSNKINSLQAVS